MTSEVETDFPGKGSRSDVVGSTESGQEVIERHLVGKIEDRETSTPAKTIAAEEIVVANGNVKEIAWHDTGWVVVVVLGVGRGDGNQRRSVLRRQAWCCQSREWGCMYASAGQSGLKLLIGREPAQIHGRLAVQRGRVCTVVEGQDTVTWHRAGD